MKQFTPNNVGKLASLPYDEVEEYIREIVQRKRASLPDI
jgi:hypothetical protein